MMHKVVSNHRKFILSVFIVSFFEIHNFLYTAEKMKINIVVDNLQKNQLNTQQQ